MSRRCEGCHENVNVAGGIGGFWTSDAEPTGGMTLELADGSEHFLCHDCMDRLPDDHEPTAEDVADL